MKKFAFLTVLTILLFSFLPADTYIRQQTKTGPFMGRPGTESTMEQWFKPNCFATVADNMTTILNLAEKKMYIVMHDSKSYIAANLPLDMTTIMPQEVAGMMKGVMDGMTVSVNANGQTKQVGKWNAKGYDVVITMMGMQMKIVMWATTEVSFDWRSMKNLTAEMMKYQMNFGDKFGQEFTKIEGYPVATEIEMMGVSASTTTLEIAEKAAPAGVYAPPAGYKQQDRFTMEEFQKKQKR